jgi:predicted transposase YbfD/YdcC
MTLQSIASADRLKGFHFLKEPYALKTDQPAPNFIDYFAELTDPRQEDRCDHKLSDILFIAICAVICGADTFTDMEEFGLAKQTWLRLFLELPNGIPSHDTFGRVLARLNPKAFQQCFLNWVRAVATLTDQEIVPIDGKTLRRSHDKANGRQAIELVSAWTRRNRLMLGQIKVAEDSNEITAVPLLLQLLELKGCIVTLDALHCQKDTAKEILKREADYVLALKGNQETLRREVERFFEAVINERTFGYEISRYETVDGEHGRIETRRYWQVMVPDYMKEKADWPGLMSVGMVESKREIKDRTSEEKRYYVSSLSVDGKRFAEAVRGHWSVENSLHWILDVVFGEDDSRVRVGHAAENFGLLRRLAVNLLQQEKTLKRGVKTKRLKAALDEGYLLKVITT